MLEFRYETERLILLMLDENYAALVLDYLQRNAERFEPYERSYGENYYTVEFQEKALEAERQLFLRSRGVRYYSFLKEDPDRIVGNVSFSYMDEDAGHRCTLGYKTDKDYIRKGYAYEAASFLMPRIISHYGIRRIEADILPENKASLALIAKLGFEYEGIARNSHEIAGRDADHARFSFIP